MELKRRENKNFMKTAKEQGLTVRGASITLLCAMLGAGVVSLHNGVGHLGIIVGAIVLVVVSMFGYFTLYSLSLGASKIKNKKNVTYFDVCYKASPVGAYLAEVAVALQGFGSNLAYMCLLQGWIASMGKEYFGFDWSKKMVGVVISLPLFVLSVQKSLKALKFATVITFFSVVYIAALILYYNVITYGQFGGIEQGVEGVVAPRDDVRYTPLLFNYGFGEGIPMFVFALGCQQSMVQVFSELSVRRVKTAAKVALMGQLLGSVLCMAIGIGAYYLLGHFKNKNVLDSLRTTEYLTSYISENTWDKHLVGIALGRVSMLVVLFTAFPMQFQPLRASTNNVISRVFGVKEKLLGSLLYRVMFSTVIILGVLGLSVALEDSFEMIVGVIGATSSSYVMYFFPSLVYLRGKEKRTPLSILSVFLMIFSVFLCVNKGYKIITSL